MNVLTNAREVGKRLVRLIERCASCQLAVAWASVGFDAFDALVAHAPKIKRMIVGTHFYQTHPKFIETFLANGNARFILNPDGVFHPKVFLFEMADGTWECIIGSPNFTRNGLSSNDEVAVLLTSHDEAAPSAIEGINAAIAEYWLRAAPVTQDELQAYQNAWNRKRVLLKSLEGKFGNPASNGDGDKGKTPFEVPILLMTWSEYFKQVQAEKTTPYGHSMKGRLRVIQFAGDLFAEDRRFKDIDRPDRRKIAGFVEATTDDPIDYRWFGSMKGSGKFQQAVNNNDEHLSLALDAIPTTGEMSRSMYLEYVDRFRGAFPEGRDGIGIASRLLAMKRPDTFVCLDARNRKGLCKAFGINQNVGYEEYWDSIIARIMEANWWCSPMPQAGDEQGVWNARAAFLDSLFYDGADMIESE
jgi:HKD family nuclease